MGEARLQQVQGMEQSAQLIREHMERQGAAWSSGSFWRRQETAQAAMVEGQQMYHLVLNNQNQQPKKKQTIPRASPQRRTATTADMDVDGEREGYTDIGGKICWVGPRAQKWTHWGS